MVPADEIVITTGSDESYLNDTETIKIQQYATVSKGTCQLPDYPLKVWGATGSIYFLQSNESTIIICGGQINQMLYTNRCFAFNQSTWTWEQTNPMKFERYGHAITTKNDGTIITCGGYSGFGQLKSCEKFDGNREWIAPLPTTLAYHCLVSINATTISSIGGVDGSEVRK